MGRLRSQRSTFLSKTITSIKNWLLYFLLIATIVFTFFRYKKQWCNYLGFTNFRTKQDIQNERNIAQRNHRILSHYSDKIIGIDVSEYQGKINWSKVVFVDRFPINFVFVRATVGNDRVDTKFFKNWNATDKKLIRGAYHYYRPNENSVEQANLFIKTVVLEQGDLPPVLDIEKLPKKQSIERLKIGLRRWLEIVENYYGIKPIIYSSDKYYLDFLAKEFSDYTFWIAHYNFFEEEINDNWQFWQFTEKSKVIGIRGNVDLNIFNGNINDLKELTIQ